MAGLFGWVQRLISGPQDGGGGSTGGSGGTVALAAGALPTVGGRVLVIHGYSAEGKDFEPWRERLGRAGIDPVTIEIGNYITLNNEVSIKDLGEALDRALRLTKWATATATDDWTFDAIVHSTGMLVVRQWLAADPFLGTGDPRSRIRRLKHLIGLAPATFGSPQAKQGRSWLGALVKGNKHLGPDFMNAGNRVLDGLELGSRFTWDLSHSDLITPGGKPLYDKGPDTPYVTVFIGNEGYDGVAAVANSPGSDGTVRWAGCALNTRKVSLDFRRTARLVGKDGRIGRYSISDWASSRLGSPVIAVQGKNHGTIVSDPDDGVAALVKRFLLEVKDEPSYTAWETDAQAFGAAARARMDDASRFTDRGRAWGGAGWQQLVVHVIDDHGDGVPDFNLQIYVGDDLSQSDDPEFAAVPLMADTYSADGSYRCFYLRLSQDMLQLNTAAGKAQKMWVELIASSGSKLLEYEAYTGGPDDPPRRLAVDHGADPAARGPVKLDITALAEGEDRLLMPYTTTLLEVFVEREPMPLGGVAEMFTFPERGE